MKAAVFCAAVAFAAALPLSAQAQGYKKELPDSLVAKAKITEDSAARVAMKRVPKGTIESVALFVRHQGAGKERRRGSARERTDGQVDVCHARISGDGETRGGRGPQDDGSQAEEAVVVEDWGLGIGEWGFGWQRGNSPIPNPATSNPSLLPKIHPRKRFGSSRCQTAAKTD